MLNGLKQHTQIAHPYCTSDFLRALRAAWLCPCRRTVSFRERAAGMYGALPFSLAQVGCATACFAMCHWLWFG